MQDELAVHDGLDEPGTVIYWPKSPELMYAPDVGNLYKEISAD